MARYKTRVLKSLTRELDNKPVFSHANKVVRSINAELLLGGDFYVFGSDMIILWDRTTSDKNASNTVN